jgi:two-component system phosphate regulon response regulator PhoB
MITILCLEDEPEVRDAILRDLAPFREHFRIEAAGDAADAAAVLGEIALDDDELGLILCDHRLPGESGIEFLAKIHAQDSWRGSRKVLLTGQADHQATIHAINEGGLNHYLAKPWKPEELVSVVREQLTRYVLAGDLDPMPYLSILEPAPLLERIAARGGTF